MTVAAGGSVPEHRRLERGASRGSDWVGSDENNLNWVMRIFAEEKNTQW